VIRRRLAWLGIALAVLGAGSLMTRGARAALPTGGITFSRETIADPFHFGGEPNLVVSPDGTVYESGILGFRSTMSNVNRSDDGGVTFNTLGIPGTGKVGQPPCSGGGDSDLASSPFNDLYFIDLGYAPEVPAHVSHNHGNTFTSDCVANLHQNVNIFADRQWLSEDRVHGVMWYEYRDGLIDPGTGLDLVDHHAQGTYIMSAPLATSAGTAASPQITFDSLCKDQLSKGIACYGDAEVIGGPVTDNYGPHKGNTYFPQFVADGLGRHNPSVAVVNPDANPKVQERTVAIGSVDSDIVLFPTVAVDRAGTIFFAWVSGPASSGDPLNLAKHYRVNFAKSFDQGQHWTTPQVITGGAPANVVIMPWLVAGDSGRVDLVFYASSQSKDPGANNGPWYGYLMQSLNAADPNPSWTAVRFTDRPMHTSFICLHGTNCYTQPGTDGDRELADFFRPRIDKDGRAMIAFDDGNNELGAEVAFGPVPNPSFPMFVRQATGPSLYASVGQVPPVPVETNSVVSPPHHNPVPFNPLLLLNGSDVDALNLVASSTSYEGDHVHVEMKVKNLDGPAATTLPALPVATYLTRWHWNGKTFLVGAEYNAGGWRYFSGEVAPMIFTQVTEPSLAYYPASGPATGSVTTGPNGLIKLDVPLSAVGGAKPGDILYSVTSYAFSHLLPSAPTPPSLDSFTDFPWIADSTAAYNVEPPNVFACPLANCAGPPVVQGPPGGLPGTGVGEVIGGLLVLVGLLVLLPPVMRRQLPARRRPG
jgi:hypothetical protein